MSERPFLAHPSRQPGSRGRRWGARALGPPSERRDALGGRGRAGEAGALTWGARPAGGRGAGGRGGGHGEKEGGWGVRSEGPRGVRGLGVWGPGGAQGAQVRRGRGRTPRPAR